MARPNRPGISGLEEFLAYVAMAVLIGIIGLVVYATLSEDHDAPQRDEAERAATATTP